MGGSGRGGGAHWGTRGWRRGRELQEGAGRRWVVGLMGPRVCCGFGAGGFLRESG